MFKYLCLATIVIFRVYCAPAGKVPDKNQTQNSVYDYNKFDEIYDQRQTGSENYKVNLDGVVVMYVPPESLLSALMQLNPLLLDGGDADIIEEIMKPLKPEKPSGSTSTTTSAPSLAKGSSLGPGSKTVEVAAIHPEVAEDAVIKRRHRFPGFIRHFLSPTFHTKKKSIAVL